MKVIGLDMSLTATGFCHPDGSTETLSSKRRGMERIEDLAEAVVERIGDDHPAWPLDERTGNAHLVVIEDYAFSRGGHAHEIGELGGVIKHTLRRIHQPYVLIGPSSLKKFATGKGNSNKTAMAVAAAKFGYEFADDNQCDAWWLRQMALYALTDRPVVNGELLECVPPQSAYRDEAVGKVAWPELVAS